VELFLRYRLEKTGITFDMKRSYAITFERYQLLGEMSMFNEDFGSSMLSLSLIPQGGKR